MATSKKRLGTKKPKIGRPPEPVPQDIADEVVEWISSGQTLRDFCRQPGKPSRQTIDKWKDKDEDFRGRIARARDDGFDVIAEECLSIADTQEPGETVTVEGEEVKTVTADMIAHRKLKIETRLKLLAKWDPRRYGDRVAHVGDSTADPIKVEQAIGPILPPTEDLFKGIEKLRDLANEHFGDK